MSSSSPRNAPSSRSKAPSGPRKRTQEVETDDGLEDDLHPDASEAIATSDGVSAAEMASSALEAADQGLRDPGSTPPPGESAHNLEQEFEQNLDDQDLDDDLNRGLNQHLNEDLDGEIEPPVASVAVSPLGQAILGTDEDEDASGDWADEMREPAVAALDTLDAPDRLEDHQPEDTIGSDNFPDPERNATFGSTPVAVVPDEEFLRRVVLPPLPHPVDAGALPQPIYDGDSQDKTVISDPPTPEMLANWRSQGRRTGWAIRRKLSAPNEVTTLELIGLVIGAALAGGIIGALFFSVPQGGSDRALSGPAAAGATTATADRAAGLPSLTPPLPRPTVEALPPAEERAAPGDQTAGAGSDRSTGRRATSSRRNSPAPRKASKKDWVDPFER